MPNYHAMSTGTLGKLVNKELAALYTTANDPKRVPPSERDAFTMEHEGKLMQIDAVLRRRELGEAK